MSSCVDLHIHTRASDGTDTPEQVLEKVLARGIRIFAVTDHDTVEGLLALEGRVPGGIRLIRGIEFSCTTPLGKCHILGYGFDPADSGLRDALEAGRRLRLEKLSRRLKFLEAHFGVVLTAREMEWLLGHASPGKPHLGRILVERGMAPDISAAIRTFINPCRGGEDRITAARAVAAIRGAGGIPVWAHPLGGEGERRITREEFGPRLAELMGYGLGGLECCYSRYDAEDTAFLLDQARTNGLLVGGGSDYHGGNKAGIALGMLNAADTPVGAGVLTVLEAL